MDRTQFLRAKLEFTNNAFLLLTCFLLLSLSFLLSSFRLLQKELGKKTAKTPQSKPATPKHTAIADDFIETDPFDALTPIKTSRSNRPLKSPKYLSESARTPTNVRLPEPFRSYREVLTKLAKHQYAFVFAQPVDWQKMGLVDYTTIIRHPMDLGTVRKKVVSMQYETQDDFVDDVELVFANAMTYNPPGHDVYVMAVKLKALFDEEIDKLPQIIAASLLKQQQKQDCSKGGKTPKPKTPSTGAIGGPMAEELQRMRMQMEQMQDQLGSIRPQQQRGRKGPYVKNTQKSLTLAEKTELKDSICALSEDKLAKVIEMITQSNPPNAANGEIEIDFDQMDIHLLRKLQRFVKSVYKPKKRKQTNLSDPSPKRPSPSTPAYQPAGFGMAAPPLTDSSAESSDEEEHTNQILPLAPAQPANSQLTVNAAAWERYAQEDNEEKTEAAKDALWMGMKHTHEEQQQRQKREEEELERLQKAQEAEHAKQQQIAEEKRRQAKEEEERQRQEREQQEIARQAQLMREREDATNALLNDNDGTDIWD